jgi:vacuolar-type H+-ATPase subunit H
VNPKKSRESHPDHLSVIQQIDQAEVELTRQVTTARQAAEDRLLQAQRDASIHIQTEQDAARQERREMVRTEMEAAELKVAQELKEAEEKAKRYFAKGNQFVHEAMAEALKVILSEKDQREKQ